MSASNSLERPTPKRKLRPVGLAMLAAIASFQMASITGASAAPALTVPGVNLQGAGVYTFNVGSLQITALADGTVPGDMHQLLRDTTEQKTDGLLQKGFVSNPVEISINVFMFKLGTRLYLVDTGSGDLFPSGFGGKLLQGLAAANVRPEQVTDILLTHAHDDHMGGLMHGGAIEFPNATVHVAKADVDFFGDRSNAAKAHYGMNYFDDYFASLKHYVDAGKVKTFEGTTEIAPGISATVHPGHTPGSTFYTVESDGQRIVFVGDIIHVGEVQFPEPDITITYDVDRRMAAKVRKDSFNQFAADRTLIAFQHIPFPGVGHVRTSGTGYEWAPIVYGNRDISKKWQ